MKHLFRRIMVLTLCVSIVLGLHAIPVSAATTYTRSGDQAADMVNYALSRVGLKDERSKMCAGFICTCAQKAGLTSTQMKLTATIASPWPATSQFGFLDSSGNPQYGCQAFSWKDFKNGDYTPKKGDLVFYGYIKGSSAGTASLSIAQLAKKDYYHVHVGMIRNNSSTTSKLYTVDGGQSGSDGSYTYVNTKTRSITASSGYAWTDDGNKIFVLEFIRPNYLNSYNIYPYLNYSGKNYLYGSDFNSLNTSYWTSRDTSVSTLSIDSTNKHNGYNSLKIVNTASGESKKDIGIKTMTQGNVTNNHYIGDSKNMILSFYAKASKTGTKMYFRWGYEDDYRSVSLTTSWAKYSVKMNKTKDYGAWMYPYIDKAGTVWMSEVQLEDGTSATSFVPENGGAYQKTTTKAGNNYTLPTEPVRSGYVFDGWYTAASGGTKITSSTAVKFGHISTYAHWSETTVPEAAIVSQPQSVTVNEGETATFRVSTSGDVSSYQWQYRTSSAGNWINISGSAATQSAYSFTAEYPQNNYQYRCVVTAASGTTLYSSEASLTVIPAPEPEAEIESQPQSITVNEGETAVFSVTTSGDISGYQWQYRTSSSGSWNNISGSAARQAVYSFTAGSSQNGYQYRCVVTAANGNTLNSSAATLTVIASSEPEADIVSQPQSVTVNEGETVTFSISTTGDVSGYQWQYRTSSSGSWNNISDSAARQASYSFTAGITQDKYQYRCVVTAASGSIIYSEAATLTVITSTEPEAEIVSQPQSVTVNEGETATFSISASGDVSGYQWQYRTSSSGSWNNISGSAARQATYSFTAGPTQNNYQYRCVVTAASGSILYSDPATLTVITSTEPEAEIVSQPQSVTVNEGETATFSISASGDVSGYQWQYRTSYSGNWINISGSAARQATYSFTAGPTQNNYQYRCVVTAASGSVLYSNAATLSVIQNSDQIDISNAVIGFRELGQTEYGEYWLTYDGTPKTPEVTVTLDGEILDSDSGYNVTYSSNINMGHAYVTVYGYGDYTGVAESSFIICYKDVPGTHNFHPGVYWATDMGIAAGYSGQYTGIFGVSDNITRGQVVTFLWRAAGWPAPESYSRSFTDVPTTHNFFEPIQWAVENGITAGYSGARVGQFGPSDYCTRGQIAMFLWRYAGWPEPEGNTQTFTDVPVTHNFYQAIQWAYEQGITTGYKDGSFGVNKNCTRGHCVTFLYRMLGEE